MSGVLKFYEVVARDAEVVYGATPWVPELVDILAGGLIPIARQNPGAREFVVVWPEELAPNQPRFPTPPWSQR